MLNNKNSSTIYNEMKDKIFEQPVIILTDFFSMKSLNFFCELAKNNKAQILITEKSGQVYDERLKEFINNHDDNEDLKELEYLDVIKKFNTLIKNNQLEFRQYKKNIKLRGVFTPEVCYSTSTLDSYGLGLRFDENDYFIPKVEASDGTKIYKDLSNIWSESKPIDMTELSNVNSAKNPEEIYFQIIKHIFNDSILSMDKENLNFEKSGFYDTVIWNKLYSFQKDAVSSAVNKIEKYNGCIIADSVGLGKTFEALAVIKYYEKLNERVLVLTPKKLYENWITYRENDTRNILSEDRFNYDVLNHTDLTREKGKSGSIDLEYVNWGNYGLVVIDESHNFRNANRNDERVTQYSKLMDYIVKTGRETKVLLLSATPINNGLPDLKNQLDIITEENDAHLIEESIPSISTVLRNTSKKIKEWSNGNYGETDSDTLLENLPTEYFKLLDIFTIARSRAYIEKYYPDIENEIGVFPEKLIPINIKSPIGKNIDIEEIAEKLVELSYCVYMPINYVFDKYIELYDINKGLTARGREKGIKQLMRTNLLKRLESSIYSFSLTLGKTINTYEDMLENIEKSTIINIELNDSDEEIILESKAADINIDHIDVRAFKSALLYDLKILKQIQEYVDFDYGKEDLKLNKLQEAIITKQKNPINANNKKILVFSAFADTVKYLYDSLSNDLKEQYNLNSAIVTGSAATFNNTIGKNFSFSDVLYHFSPISKGAKVNQEIDILFATDCISEGQNLQDCDVVINYDIHWNPVRLIQRFGRVDRIGSTNKRIQMINFWPEMELDKYINLENIIKEKSTIGSLSTTGSDNVFEKEKELEYRAEQLEKIQNETINLEDLNDNISLTDFNFDDFKNDLQRLSRKYNNQIAYNGSYSVIETSEYNGVICLFEDIVGDIENNKSNPFYPYVLLHISDDGEIVHDSRTGRKILDKLKLGSQNNAGTIKQLSKEKINKTRNLIDIAHGMCSDSLNDNAVESYFAGGLNIFKDEYNYVLRYFMILEEK